MSREVFIVGAERRLGAFSNPVISWQFGFRFGMRYEKEVISRKKYSSPDAALRAGTRQSRRLMKFIANDWSEK